MLKIKFIELFAGIGGFRYGLERCGIENKGPENKGTGNKERQFKQCINRNTNRFTCVYANEWDKYAAKIYEKNFGERPDTRDIRTVDADEIPNHDLLTGGFPCQAFSIAGKRKGFEDTRGTLFFDIARILDSKRPGMCLLENVKGLLSHDNGDTFRTILWVLYELGYDVQWQVLNSKDFGVPQNRERVFIVGHLRGKGRPEVFPIRKDGCQVNDIQGQISNTLTARYELAQATGTYIGEDKFNAQGTIMIGGLQKHQTPRNDGISPALTEAMGKGGGQIPILLNKIRRLTPIECERLQGFPDNWTEGVSDTQRYKMLGNAVTTNVITEIGKRLLSETK